VPEVSGADQVAPQVPPPIEDLDPNAKSAATMVKPGPARLLPSCGTWWLSRPAPLGPEIISASPAPAARAHLLPSCGTWWFQRPPAPAAAAAPATWGTAAAVRSPLLPSCGTWWFRRRPPWPPGAADRKAAALAIQQAIRGSTARQEAALPREEAAAAAKIQAIARRRSQFDEAEESFGALGESSAVQQPTPSTGTGPEQPQESKKDCPTLPRSSVPPLEPVPEVSGADQVAPQVPPPIEDLDPNAKSAATMVKPGPARLLPSCGTWWLSRPIGRGSPLGRGIPHRSRADEEPAISRRGVGGATTAMARRRQAAAITSPLPRQHRAVADTDSFCTWSSTSSSRRRSSGAEAPCGCARRSGSAPCRRAIGSARSSWCDAALLDSDSAEPIRPTPRVAWACAKDAIHNIDDESTMDGESRHESTPHSVDEHAEEGASGFGASEGIPASIMMAGMILVLLL